MVSNYLSDNHHAWEIYPSTRSSVHLWTKYHPFDVTLTTAGTAQNVWSVGDILIPVVNLATNPSMETTDPPATYTASGATLTRQTTVARSQTNSLRIDPDNLAVGEGAYWATPSLGSGADRNNQTYIIASAYFQDNVGSSNTSRLAIRSTAGVLLSAGNTITLSAAWQRSIARYPLTITGTDYRVYFETVAQHNTNFYVDDFQVEIRKNSNATDYCDGTLGLNYEWMGTANASESRRRRGLYAIRGFDLHVTGDVYIAFDHTASSTTGTFVRAGSDWSKDFPVHFKDRLSFINVNTGETPRVYGTLWGVPTGENVEG